MVKKVMSVEVAKEMKKERKSAAYLQRQVHEALQVEQRHLELSHAPLVLVDALWASREVGFELYTRHPHHLGHHLRTEKPVSYTAHAHTAHAHTAHTAHTMEERHTSSDMRACSVPLPSSSLSSSEYFPGDGVSTR